MSKKRKSSLSASLPSQVLRASSPRGEPKSVRTSPFTQETGRFAQVLLIFSPQMWYIQSNLIFYGLTHFFSPFKGGFVCCLIVSLRCVFWAALSIRGIDSPRPASQRAAAFILTAVMLTTLAAPAFAGTWSIENGDITVKAGETGNDVTQNNVTTKMTPTPSSQIVTRTPLLPTP